MKLKLGPTLSLPADAVTQTFGFFGRKGSGKTYAAGVLVEQLLGAELPVVVIDPVGNWYGLRFAPMGKSASQFKIPILGGERGDIALQATAGQLVAKTIVDTGTSAVLDVSLFHKAERKRFMADFAEELFHRKKTNRGPMHLVIEEAQLFAPQMAKGEERLLGAIEDVVRLGRNYGIGVSMLSQRPQSINTEVRNQCEPLVIFQLVAKHERDAVKGWMQHMGVDADLEELSRLKTGECFFWSPAWLEKFERLRFGTKSTYDASSTPTVGSVRAPGKLNRLNLSTLESAMVLVVEEAKANDPKELKRQIAELQKQLAAKPKAAVAAAPAKDQAASDRAVAAYRAQVERELAAERRANQSLIKALRQRLAKVAELASTNGLPAEPVQAELPKAAVSNAPIYKDKSPDNGHRAATPKPARKETPRADGDVHLGKCELAILRVLSQFPDGCQVDKLTLLAGYRFSGGFRNSLGTLRSAGLIEGENTGTLRITDSGMAVDEFDPLPSGEALAEYWLSHPSFGKCERAILRALIDHPEGLDAHALCSATGYEFSGGFRNSLGSLRKAGVITGKNTETMKASDELLGVGV
ncbi:MAG TPA: DUF87 domain-containing protein [Pirellulales bacterium]|nr:DUF87 domain-containing protein [Pirellulales bacterium]